MKLLLGYRLVIKNLKREYSWLKMVPLVLLVATNIYHLKLKTSIRFSGVDALIYLFSGVPPFIKEDGWPVFEMPLVWFSLLLYISLQAFHSFIRRDTLEQQFIMRSQNHQCWFLGKICTSLLVIIGQTYFCYLLTYASCLLLNQNMALAVTYPSLSLALFDIPAPQIGLGSFFLIMVPVLQILLFLLMSFCYLYFDSYLVSVGTLVLLLISSVYFVSPFLLGELLMLLRCTLLFDDQRQFYACFLGHLLWGIGLFFLMRKKIAKMEF